jgi:uncharacterized membrane protein YuzA (DUF378 family)
VVNGDVFVYADTVTVGPNAKILGALQGEASAAPKIDEGASIGANEVKIVERDDIPTPVHVPSWVYMVVGGLICLVTALFAERIAGGHTQGAADLLKSQPLAFLGRGILWTVLLPIMIVLLCVPIVTIPISVASLLTLLAAHIVSLGFMAASLGRLLMGKVGRYKTALIMGIVFGALSVLPYANYVVRGLAHVFIIGYVFLSIHNRQQEQGGRSGQPELPYANVNYGDSYGE